MFNKSYRRKLHCAATKRRFRICIIRYNCFKATQRCSKANGIRVSVEFYTDTWNSTEDLLLPSYYRWSSIRFINIAKNFVTSRVSCLHWQIEFFGALVWVQKVLINENSIVQSWCLKYLLLKSRLKIMSSDISVSRSWHFMMSVLFKYTYCSYSVFM